MVATAAHESLAIDRSACPSTGGHGTKHYRQKRGCTCPDAYEDQVRHYRGLRYGDPIPPLRVSPVGSRRHLQAAAVVGWGLRPIADATGLTPTTLCHIRQGAGAPWAREHYIHTARDKAIRAAVTDLLTRHPRPTGPGATRARTLAARQQWVPLGVWVDVDDPDERPDRRHVRGNRPRPRDVAADAAELVAQGEHTERVTERTGLNPKALEHGLRRHRARTADAGAVA